MLKQIMVSKVDCHGPYPSYTGCNYAQRGSCITLFQHKQLGVWWHLRDKYLFAQKLFWAALSAASGKMGSSPQGLMPKEMC